MKKKILVVDDSASLRLVVRDALEEAGYDVIEAGDGIEGLAQLETNQVQLILADVNMPNMDGITFVRAVRERDDCRFVPIIMLTTESQENKKLQGQMAGAKAWVVKPFQPEQVLRAVAKLILP